jgi:O-antigen/teichoic acid export membrane protein
MGLKKNMLSNVVLTTSTIFISFITFPYVTRVLSPENMGNVLFLDAFTQYFIVFSSLGIPFYGVREIAKLKGNHQGQYELVSSLVCLQFVLSILYSILFVGLSLFIPSLRSTFDLVILGCLTIIATSFSIEWFYQGIENFSYITKRSLIIKALSVLAIFLFVKRYDDHFAYYFILFAVILCNSLLNFGNYILKFSKSFKYDIAFKAHIKPLLVLFSINVSVSVYVILDTIILGLFTDTTNVSYYSIPLKLAKMVWVVVGGSSVVLIPRVSQYYSDGNVIEAGNLLKKSLSLVFLITIPFAVLCIFFSKEVLFVVFGSKYLAAAVSLQILSVVPLIIGICNVFGTQFLLPIGHEKYILHATICGLIVSLLLNFLLIPHFKYIGSSIACIAAETAVCVYVYLKAKSQIKVQVDRSLLKHIILTSVVALLAGLLLKNYLLNLSLLVIICIIYVVTFFGFQYFVFKNAFINSLLRVKSMYNE